VQKTTCLVWLATSVMLQGLDYRFLSRMEEWYIPSEREDDLQFHSRTAEVQVA